MPTCPNGHQSGSDDWCEVCGHRMAGAVPPPPPPPPGTGGYGFPPPAGAPGRPGPAAAGPEPELCPQCRTPREGGAPFCEECRWNFLTNTATSYTPAAPRPPQPRFQPPSSTYGGGDGYEYQGSRPSQVNRPAEPIPSFGSEPSGPTPFGPDRTPPAPGPGGPAGQSPFPPGNRRPPAPPQGFGQGPGGPGGPAGPGGPGSGGPGAGGPSGPGGFPGQGAGPGGFPGQRPGDAGGPGAGGPSGPGGFPEQRPGGPGAGGPGGPAGPGGPGAGRPAGPPSGFGGGPGQGPGSGGPSGPSGFGGGPGQGPGNPSRPGGPSGPGGPGGPGPSGFGGDPSRPAPPPPAGPGGPGGPGGAPQAFQQAGASAPPAPPAFPRGNRRPPAGEDDWVISPPSSGGPGQDTGGQGGGYGYPHPGATQAPPGQGGPGGRPGGPGGQGGPGGFPQAPQQSQAPQAPQVPHQSQGHGQGARPGTWTATIGPDREYFMAMMQRSGPEAAGLNLPAYSPEQQRTLSGNQVTIGRRRHSTGDTPDIDLSVPPEDPGVSHQHAMLVQQPDGSWAVVDQNSTNGTTVNMSEEPIQPFVPVPLQDGDRVHVGAWTTITVRRG
ncbi:FHA domain-containing protein [Streptomyces achromogenes]|uniref:FHA domain-containing protein n=1 Tax=Streptomyces achromogenes TaxID=67255 RepID=UPI0036B9E8C3